MMWHRVLGMGALVVGLMCGGCLSPSTTPYPFLQKTTRFAPYFGQVYNESMRNQEDMLKIIVSTPLGGKVLFDGGGSFRVAGGRQDLLSLKSGVYPFRLKFRNERGDRDQLVGALMAYNLDSTVALATLGLTQDTAVFKPELIKVAQSGMLASQTIRYDNKEVLTYWLGNRHSLYPGGAPTVELDFSGTPGITSLSIDGESLPTFRKEIVLTDRNPRRKEKEYPFQMTAGGTRYRGFIRNLKHNESTAFVAIPCAITQDLLTAVADGTVSQFSIKDPSHDNEDIAVIVLSGE
jgi:hypothetical protein